MSVCLFIFLLCDEKALQGISDFLMDKVKGHTLLCKITPDSDSMQSKSSRACFDHQ